MKCYKKNFLAATGGSTRPILLVTRSVWHQQHKHKIDNRLINRSVSASTNQAFCVAGPIAWNSLPLDIRSAPTLSIFKNMLKTHLFSRFYFSD